MTRVRTFKDRGTGYVDEHERHLNGTGMEGRLNKIKKKRKSKKKRDVEENGRKMRKEEHLLDVIKCNAARRAPFWELYR